MGCNDIEIRKSEFADENSIPLLNSDSGPQKTEIKKSKFVAKKNQFLNDTEIVP